MSKNKTVTVAKPESAKVSDLFKVAIRNFLESQAQKDSLFAETFAKPGKNIDDCCTYILNQVKASGCVGFADDEIFGMAMHYYDEDQIEVGKPINARVVVNHVVELTEEEKEKAKQAAFDKAVAEKQAQLKKRAETAAQKKATSNELSLF
ncbi:PcfK-like protein [Siphonobacter sp. BAB-5405]|uniref:PcfK-like family protein n=1 Tax=Siphonobacter sp. BAB-5405 TaxID=1864825 RepID=UPI000C80D033|nr:PcfK-like family protein [Siphonobacter sp. BAB-5405]PMD94863.1 PcfK-like protein [Siphonobacter sp. BAB-5405]